MKAFKSAVRLCSIVISAGVLAVSASAQGPVFSNIPSTLPSEFYSTFNYDAQSTLEFGGIVQPNLTNGDYLTNATVVLDNFALESNFLDYGTSSGYNVNLTLTLYNVNSDGSVGSQIASQTIDPTIAWATSETGNVQEVSFGFNGVALPSQFIWGLSIPSNYSDGDNGPDNDLSLALTEDPYIIGFYPTTVGTDLAYSCSSGEPASQPSTNYCDTVYYADDNDAFGQTAPFALTYGTGVVEFDAESVVSPEPATFGLIGLGLIGVSVAARRRKNRG